MAISDDQAIVPYPASASENKFDQKSPDPSGYGFNLKSQEKT
jgi:hypothetical protein